MAVTIKKVSNKYELKQFIRFNYKLYKRNPYSVPDLYEDMLGTFTLSKNPAFEFCEADYFLAYKDNKLVGRVAAILNRRANETWNKKEVRFGWIDFIDDLDVSKALLDAVAQWGKERGMTAMIGPMGFTDMDAEGMLIEGFDKLGTMATIYNYPYYSKHMELLGCVKEVDWVEYKITIPKEMPEKHKRISEMLMQRYHLKIRKIKNRKEVNAGLGRKIFDLINEAYAPLYGYSKMTQEQIDLYVNEYLTILDLRMVTVIEDEEENVIGVGISMASISEALQKAKGKLFPFGWFYLSRALFWRRPNTLDLLLVAVKPEYQSKGVNALLFYDLIPMYNKLGFKYAESNPELEINSKVQAQWTYFEHELHKRRRAYKKEID